MSQINVQRLPCGNKIYLTTPNEILKLLKEIDTKKTIGFVMIPPKLVKVDAHVCNSLSKTCYKVSSHMMLKLLYFLQLITLLLKRVKSLILDQ